MGDGNKLIKTYNMGISQARNNLKKKLAMHRILYIYVKKKRQHTIFLLQIQELNWMSLYNKLLLLSDILPDL